MCVSAPDRIRTCDLWLRRPTLYPAELRARTAERETNKPSSVTRRPAAAGCGSFLWGAGCPSPLAAYPGLERRGPRLAPAWPCTGWGLPCHRCRQRRGGLLPHRFTLACARAEPSAVCSLWHCPSPGRRPGVTRHPALWSSDFPRPARNRPRSTLSPVLSNSVLQTEKYTVTTLPGQPVAPPDVVSPRAVPALIAAARAAENDTGEGRRPSPVSLRAGLGRA
jgi:hypothetical protein